MKYISSSSVALYHMIGINSILGRSLCNQNRVSVKCKLSQDVTRIRMKRSLGVLQTDSATMRTAFVTTVLTLSSVSV